MPVGRDDDDEKRGGSKPRPQRNVNLTGLNVNDRDAFYDLQIQLEGDDNNHVRGGGKKKGRHGQNTRGRETLRGGSADGHVGQHLRRKSQDQEPDGGVNI